jgi:cytochrome P450
METDRRSEYYRLTYTLLVVFSSYALYCAFRRLTLAYRIRSRYHDLPSLPRHLIWGNLINAGKRLDPSLNRHPDYGLEEIWQELGQPGCFVLDLAPISQHGLLVIAEPKHAEALLNPSETFKYSLPKDSEGYRPIKALIGAESIITKEGSDWKATRKRFNPGFQPKHIHSLTEQVATRVRVFVSRLQRLADGGEPFKLADYAQDLTFDIITQIAIAKDLNAQLGQEEKNKISKWDLPTVSRRLSRMTMGMSERLLGLHMLNPVRPITLAIHECVYDSQLTTVVKDSISSANAASARSIVQLAVRDMLPSKALVRTCVDQVKSFLFAGQDTTATLIQWLCYEMSKANQHPRRAIFLQRLRQEHDAVFGPGAFSALDKLSATVTGETESTLASSLPFTTAFIKETLRIHPPAATGREVPGESTSTTLSISDQDVSVAGLQIYACQWLIHRNPKIWGADAHDFNPDRWLDEAYVANLPPGSYRPFERGPRNCIGQELAMLEGLVVLCAVARAFDFEKVGLDGRPNANGEFEKEVWNMYAVTSVPVDGMVMRVRKASD